MIPQIICVVGPTATRQNENGRGCWPTASAARWCPWTPCRSTGAWPSAPPPPLRRRWRASPTTWWAWPIPPRAGPWPGSYRRPMSVCRISSAGARRPILVGGTGLYLESLIRGTDFAAGQRRRCDPAAPAAAAGAGGRRPAAGRAANQSTRTAPQGCTPADEKRILRALEV